MQNVRPFQDIFPQIAEDAWIDESAVVIGNVKIGPRASIWPMCVVRGDVHRIEIGTDSNIQDGTIVHVTSDTRFMPGGAPTIVHDRVTVGHQAMLHGCEIKDECMVGIGTTILDRAVLESRTMVGAGSLVPPGKVLEGGYLWVGTPVKRVRTLKDSEIEKLAHLAEHYTKLTNQHRESASGLSS